MWSDRMTSILPWKDCTSTWELVILTIMSQAAHLAMQRCKLPTPLG